MHRCLLPLTTRRPITSLRPQRRGPNLRLHLQLRRAPLAPHPRLSRQHASHMASRPPLRIQPRRPSRLLRAGEQPPQIPSTRPTQNLPVAENQPLGPNRGRIPPTPARSRNDIRDHRERDQCAAAGNRDFDHEGPQPRLAARQYRPGGGGGAHQLGAAESAGYETD